MITDIFSRRYASVQLRPQYFQEDHRFMNQAVMLVGNSLWTGYPDPNLNDAKIADATEAGLTSVHNIIALELGCQTLSDQWWWSTHTWNGNTSKTAHKNTYAAMVKAFLIKIPEDVAKGDVWVKERLSLIELAYRRRASQITEQNQSLPARIAGIRKSDWTTPPGHIRFPIDDNRREIAMREMNERINNAFSESVTDLNERMRQAGYKLHYHNGFIQLSDDELTQSEVGKPFWSLVLDSRFANVDLQMKEAIDRRDKGDRTAAFHAVCALESCIKIISDIKGWTTGRENGAANYIDNLNSRKNGRFLEPWESEFLKSMFSDVRNPFAHGPGQTPMPTLTPEQTDWAIDTTMTWCKNLLKRL
jgi:AbiJ N-terminal domain 4